MVGAVIGGAALATTRWYRLGRRLFWAAAAVLLVGGLSPLADLITAPLENRFPRTDIERHAPAITGIIVLGGGEDSRVHDRKELAALNEAAERYTESIVLT